MKNVHCINLYLNFGWFTKDQEKINALDFEKTYLVVRDSKLVLTDGTTEIESPEYSTLGIQVFEEGNPDPLFFG